MPKKDWAGKRFWLLEHEITGTIDTLSKIKRIK